MLRQTRQRGFTLIELMVVISIIGILAAIGIPRVQAYLRSSETAEVAMNAGRLVGLIAAYRDTSGKTANQIETDIDGLQVTPAGGAGELADLIPAATIPADAKFSFTVRIDVANAGPLNNEAVTCILTTGLAASSNAGGEVYYSEVRTTAAGWDGNVNRTNFVSGGSPVKGGHCNAAGDAQADCTDCP